MTPVLQTLATAESWVGPGNEAYDLLYSSNCKWRCYTKLKLRVSLPLVWLRLMHLCGQETCNQQCQLVVTSVLSTSVLDRQNVIHMIKYTRSSPPPIFFFLAYCKWSKTGQSEGMGTRLLLWSVDHLKHGCITDWAVINPGLTFLHSALQPCKLHNDFSCIAIQGERNVF